MQDFEKLEPGKLYHIFNKGIDGTEIFSCSKDYEHFLYLYEKHIDPCCKTYAWCLMGNHFHLLVEIRKEFDIPDWKKDPTLIENSLEVTSAKVTQAFSNLFNAYAQYFNHQKKRTGALFQTPFKRKEVTNSEQFKALVFYIHNNPIKHGFTDKMIDYPWSSYHQITSFSKADKSKKDLFGWFNSEGEFIDYHKKSHDILKITSLLFS